MSEWETEAENAGRQLPAVNRGKNFVAPASQPVVSTPPVWTPAQAHELQPAQSVGQIVTMATSHVDRAKGFGIKTASLAAVIGGLAVIVAVVGFRVPLLSLPILLWFGTGFGIVWLAAYLWSEAASPDGVTLFQVFGGLRLVRHEQKFRHEYIRHVTGMLQPDERRHQRKIERKQKGRR
jgi:hypothetical protein